MPHSTHLFANALALIIVLQVPRAINASEDTTPSSKFESPSKYFHAQPISPGPWPTGQFGDLVVHSGEVFRLLAGQCYDYQSITVESGGTLEIVPIQGAGWTIIGTTGDFVLKGTLVSHSNRYCDGTYMFTAPDGQILNTVVARQHGGRGGNAYGRPPCNGGEASHKPNCGNGGGGASCGGPGLPGTARGGGNGGTSPSLHPTDEIGKGGMGGLWSSVDGQDGGGTSGTSQFTLHFGGGGGGGAAGADGGLVYLRVLGHFDASGGIVDLAGQSGGSGGAGGGGQWCEPGGGGGGGSGGNGGYLFLRLANSFGQAKCLLGGGAGGHGGKAGRGNLNYADAYGQGGADGHDGTKGVFHLEQQ